MRFIHFLIETYGLDKVKLLYTLEARPDEEKDESSWETALNTTLDALEVKWLNWLTNRFELEQEQIESFLTKPSPVVE
ncbi:hypothetical protein EH223_10670 [candidate division KSB1 bacterium]|nr:hypothetical protein [candidate division KSB1 bacterium]RQW03218.1 MAG: hypothetical protein EH223_10670 [candidate division KSB1 bacterium]